MDELLTNALFTLSCFHIQISNLALLSILAVVQFLIVDNFPLQLSCKMFKWNFKYSRKPQIGKNSIPNYIQNYELNLYVRYQKYIDSKEFYPFYT